MALVMASCTGAPTPAQDAGPAVCDPSTLPDQTGGFTLDTDPPPSLLVDNHAIVTCDEGSTLYALIAEARGEYNWSSPCSDGPRLCPSASQVTFTIDGGDPKTCPFLLGAIDETGADCRKPLECSVICNVCLADIPTSLVIQLLDDDGASEAECVDLSRA